MNYDEIAKVLESQDVDMILVTCDWMEEAGLEPIAQRIREIARTSDPRAGMVFWARYFRREGDWFDLDMLSNIYPPESVYLRSLELANDLGMMRDAPKRRASWSRLRLS